MPRDHEYECKLGGDAAKLRAVKKAAEALSRQKLHWAKDDLESVYYDTPDLRLGKRRVTLRVRKKGGRFLQNVKSDNTAGGGLFARGEWEQEIDSLTPRLDLLPEAAINVLGLVLPGELRETFRTRFVRDSAVILRQAAMGPESRVEIAIDVGEVIVGKGRAKAGAKREAIQECELELLQGDPRDLFELALQLQQTAGLSILQESKAARGYRLLEGRTVAPHKADKTDLRPDASVNQAITDILRAGIRHMLANEAASAEGKDPEGVHQFRVAVRRMRSMLSVFSRLLDPSRVDWLKDELKWIAAQFGPARDWDVFIDEIMGPVAAAGIEPAAMAVLAEAAQAKRAAAYGPVRAALESPRYAALVLKLSAFTETQAWSPQPCPEGHPLADTIAQRAPKLLSRAHKKVLTEGRDLKNLDAPARHLVRIRLKKLRYTTDFLQSIYDGHAKAHFHKALSQLQDDFGHLNDVAVAESLLAELVAENGGTGAKAQALHTAAAAVVGWHARGLYDSEPKLLADWDAFADCKPFWLDD